MSGGCPANHTVTKCPSSMSRSRFRPFVLWNLPSRTSCGPASVLESGGLGRGAHDKETQEAAERDSQDPDCCSPALRS